MTSEAFDQAYQSLNAAQREAVDTVEGPVMVVAGPGTGKTQILALRIANILLKTHTRPGNILALTFTESGVTSMRRRLVSIVGSPAYSVAINTFHGFCNDVISRYPEEFPRIIGSASITEIDQIKMLEEVIDSTSLKFIKPFGDKFHYLKPALAAINSLKREGVTPEEFQKIITKERETLERRDDLYHQKGRYVGQLKGEHKDQFKRLDKLAELGGVYQAYQAKLAELRYYDFNDMIMETLAALENNSDLLLNLQEQYHYFLVDEHQDTNRAQNRVLELLCNFHDNPNIFVVGDEKQAIFRFQGASLENFNYFKKLYPEAKLIALEENYRSAQEILDLSHDLLAGPVALRSGRAVGPASIRLLSFRQPETEAFFLATDIADRLEAGVPAEEIAVLYRDNRDARPIANLLEKKGVPFAIESDQDLMTDPELRKLVILLEAVRGFGNDEYLVPAFHIDFLRVDPLDTYRLAELARAERVSMVEILDREQELNLKNREAAAQLVSQLAKWKIDSHNFTLAEFIETVIRESGFLVHLLARPDGAEKMEKLNALFDEVQKLADKHPEYDFEQFMSYLDLLVEHGVMIKRSAGAGLAGRVRLMTAHRSKGLEFEYVYITNVYDGHWGNKRRPEKLPLPPQVYLLSGEAAAEGSTNDDERRLFYVALTRAKQSITLTYAERGADGREQLPSQFLTELRSDLITVSPAAGWEQKFGAEREILYGPARRQGLSIKDTDYLAGLFAKNGLSVTALNNYLACPWKYFYTNLIRVPRAKVPHQLYGTAVHAALKDLFDQLGNNRQLVDKEYFLNKFQFHLEAGMGRHKDYQTYLERGQTALAGYFDAYQTSWAGGVLTEVSIPAVVLSENLRLTGKIDKVEILDDDRINVVDYKTGKPKSRGEIEGTTKSSNGDLKRQLVFYKILVDSFFAGKYKMVSGEIDFVEPDERGKHKRERLEISEADVAELKQLIEKVAEEIKSLGFWEGGCGEADCEYCRLRELMN
jgi:DNA helicase II / ATP-dependent DNA helicase PcrA